MGDLIMMSRSSARFRREAPSAGAADILFFTGVRYVRLTDADVALANVTPPRRATKPRRRPAKTAIDVKSA